MYVAGRPTFKKEWTIGNRTLYSVGSRGGGGDKGWVLKKVFFSRAPLLDLPLLYHSVTHEEASPESQAWSAIPTGQPYRWLARQCWPRQ